MNTLKNKACIVGIGQTEYTRNAGRAEVHLAIDAILGACADAGLEPKQIDGISGFGTAGVFLTEMASDVDIARSLGIPNLRFFNQTPWGGGACCGTVAAAAMAVACGVANYVVCYRSLRLASGTIRYGKPVALPKAAEFSYTLPYGLANPTSWVAMLATRWMHETGATVEQLGACALVCRENANRNPRAIMYGRPLTMQDYLNSPMHVEPFKLHDQCQENDGCCAVIVTTPERAKDLRQKPAYISAASYGTAEDASNMHSYYRRQIGLPEQIYAGKDLFRMAEITQKDVDVIQLYDAFTPLIPMQLETYDFVKYGEGGAFCEGGDRIRPTGELPVNTSGGLLSESYIHGMNLIAEGVRQIRGTSTTQIKDVEVSMVTAASGVPTGALMLTHG